VKRRLFNLLAGLSLMLCAATAMAWVSSYWVTGFIGRRTLDPRLDNPRRESAGLWSGRGGIGYVKSQQLFPPRVDLLREEKTLVWQMPTDGRLHWLVTTKYTQYPFVAIPPLPGDRWGFCFHHFDSTAPPPWKTDGSQLRRWRLTAEVVPYGLPFFLFAVWPTLYFAPRLFHRLRIARRTRRGLCTVCGYDLRATVERCPECGAPVRSISRVPD